MADSSHVILSVPAMNSLTLPVWQLPSPAIDSNPVGHLLDSLAHAATQVCYNARIF